VVNKYNFEACNHNYNKNEHKASAEQHNRDNCC